MLVGILISGASAFGSPHSSAAVEIRTFKFRPDTLVVAAGTTVTWTNSDEIEHTVTLDSAARRGQPTLNGTLDKRGATYRVSFDSAGDFPYHCERHAFMRGVVHVNAKGE